MAIKVNLGCGPVGKDDWVNLDWGVLALLHHYKLLEKALLKFGLLPKGYNVPWPKNLRLHNCKKRLPFEDNSVEYIYASHFLEHFKKFEAQKILAESYRVLKKGGVLRIGIPDLELLVKKYLQRDVEYFRRLSTLMNFGEEKVCPKALELADVLMDNFYPGFHREEPRGINRLLIRFIRPHLWMYDSASLTSILEDAGFQNIQRRQFRQGRVPDLDYLDVFSEMTLYMEAEK